VSIAEDDGRIVAFAAGSISMRDQTEELSVIDYRNGEITELYVVPEARGRGIGRELLARLEVFFREKGCDCMRIEVFAYNERARSFYAELGFEERDIDLFKPLSSGAD
jgi:ribosomal protein S18 acetylase RimI-like enzyme